MQRVILLFLHISFNSHWSMATGGIVSSSHKEQKGSSLDVNFPQTLVGFGYKFEGGQLRHITTGGSFVFEVKKDDPFYNQRRYEALGEVITNYVYDLLITEGKLTKLFVPLNATGSEAKTFIFHSQDAFSNKKLIVLIHGSGVVRAGQWSRKLIINDCLDSGTQLPFIKKAQKMGFGVIVLNTNDNWGKVNGIKKIIRGSESPEKHTEYVWKELIAKSNAKRIAVVAHSYGAVVAVNMFNTFPSESMEKIFAVAFTDPVHSFASQRVDVAVVLWLQKVSRTWVSSNKPVDTAVQNRGDGMDYRSAGTSTHEMTSWSSFLHVFHFIERWYSRPLSSERTQRREDL